MAVQMRSMLEVADNSGARKLQMILPLGGASGKKAGLGDVITAAVKEASPDGPVKKGKVVKAVVVRTRKEHRRRDGTYIRFDENAAVLINDARRAGGNARLWSGCARTAREEVFEDCFAGTGSSLKPGAGLRRKSYGEFEHTAQRQGQGHLRDRSRASRAAFCACCRKPTACW